MLHGQNSRYVKYTANVGRMTVNGPLPMSLRTGHWLLHDLSLLIPLLRQILPQEQKTLPHGSFPEARPHGTSVSVVWLALVSTKSPVIRALFTIAFIDGLR